MLIRILKRLLIGEPLKLSQANEEKLSNSRALAIFSSDALSSVAYATEAILLALFGVGSLVLGASLPIAIAITALIIIVISSYRQTVIAYPHGGGSYRVARENLGIYPGLVAAAALLIDYILTVAVSVSAGVSAICSAFPELGEFRVWMALVFIVLLAILNLRGVRDVGRYFTVPTYAFVICLGALIIIGFGRYFLDPSFNYNNAKLSSGLETINTLSIFLLLKAFASGCTALTGIEAISDGVQAFREPTGKNAKKTLFYLGLILSSLFLGITVLAKLFGIFPQEGETVVSQIARVIFFDTWAKPFYFLVQGATMLILLLASNTAFADFPRLAGFLAEDEFMPNHFKKVGDRLVKTFGIRVLAISSIGLIWFFKAREHALLPFYAIGVFTAFTLSQTGMAVFWWRKHKESKSAYFRFALGLFGAFVTGIVLLLELITKASRGAFLVPVIVFFIVIVFNKIKAHYTMAAKKLAVKDYTPEIKPKHTMVLFIDSVNRASLKALARAISQRPSRIMVAHISSDREKAEKLREKWELNIARLLPKWSEYYSGDLPLEIIHCEYSQEGYVVSEAKEFVRAIDRRYDDDTVTVIMPHLVTHGGFEHSLHNRTALAIVREIEEDPGINADIELVPCRFSEFE